MLKAYSDPTLFGSLSSPAFSADFILTLALSVLAPFFFASPSVIFFGVAFDRFSLVGLFCRRFEHSFLVFALFAPFKLQYGSEIALFCIYFTQHQYSESHRV